MARELQASPHGTNILICWHHEQIPDLLRALGADPAVLLPEGRWPGHVYGWVIELRYDGEGNADPETNGEFEVLSGADSSPTFARLAPEERRAALEILVATKPDLPAYYRAGVGR